MVNMFERFGELESYKEINTLAENLFNEGDELSLYALAKENGIPKDFVDMYLQEISQSLWMHRPQPLESLILRYRSLSHRRL